MADQNSGLADLHSRKGKARAANGDWPRGAANCRREQQIQGGMPTRPPPLGWSPQSKGTITGNNEIYCWENPFGPFVCPCPPPPSSLLMLACR